MRSQRLSIMVLAVTVLAGCKTLDVQSPDLAAPPIPNRFRHAPDEAPVAESLLKTAWWTGLNRPELSDWMDRAMRDNPDLKIAGLQVVQAEARAKIVRAGGKPNVSVPVVVATQSSSSTVGTAPVTGDRSTQTIFQASVQASWRVDIWGEQAAREESADLQVLRAIYQREDIRRNVTASLLTLYVSALSLNDSMRIAEEVLRASEDVLSVVSQRYALRDATVTELEQQRAAVAVQSTVLPVLRQQQEEIKSQIGQMLGTTTDQVRWPYGGLEDLALPVVNVGLPSSMLLRRPDVRMMEARMRAARADLDVARAQFLPPLDLSFQAGQSALRLAQLLRPENLFWSAVGSVTAAIFDGGRRDAQTEESKAIYEEMVLMYGKVIHQSLREVESALSLVRNARDRYESQQKAMVSARELFGAANRAYMVGALDQGGLADARRAYQRQHDDMLRSKAEALRANVSVAQALAIL